MKITIERHGQRAVLVDLREQQLIPSNEPEGSVLYWARKKGHVPAPQGKFRGDFHRGPHVRVVARHMRWPLNKIVSEDEYDSAVSSAYAVCIGEDLVGQWAAFDAATLRAEGKTISIADDGEEVTS